MTQVRQVFHAGVGRTPPRIKRIVDRTPIEDLAQLVDQASRIRSLAWPRRLNARDAELHEVARQIIAAGRAFDGKPLARAVIAALSRYGTSAWLYERDKAEPEDPWRRSLWRVLKYGDGKVPSLRQAMNILSGNRTPRR